MSDKLNNQMSEKPTDLGHLGTIHSNADAPAEPVAGEAKTKKVDDVIPSMTDPLSQYWEQPPLSAIEIDDEFARMSTATFESLHEYSASKPSGAYEGKMWRRHDGSFDREFLRKGGKPVWLLCWYGVSTIGPGYVSNNSRKIVLTDAPTVAAPEGEAKLHDTMDAVVWAREFIRIFGGKPSPDEGTMIGWFANAIMVGWDFAKRATPPTSQVSGAGMTAQKELYDAWRAWLDQYGVPISEEFVRLANAVGTFTEPFRAAHVAQKEK